MIEYYEAIVIQHTRSHTPGWEQCLPTFKATDAAKATRQQSQAVLEKVREGRGREGKEGGGKEEGLKVGLILLLLLTYFVL